MKNRILSLLHYLGLTRYLRSRKTRLAASQPQDAVSVSILSLHRISPEKDACWQPIQPKNFEAILQYAAAHYEVLRLSDLATAVEKRQERGGGKLRPLMVLSFDDGYADFMQYALPLLQKYNLPCNHNFVIDCLEDNACIWTQRFNHIFNELLRRDTATENFNPKKGGWYRQYIAIFRQFLQYPAEERMQRIADLERAQRIEPPKVDMMRWADLKDCLLRYGNLLEIGAHTHTHDVLPTLCTQAGAQALHKEIFTPKGRLESELQIPISIFALPNGQNHEQINTLAKQAGYNFLLEVGDQIAHDTQPQEQEMQILPRLNMIDEPIGAAALRIERLW